MSTATTDPSTKVRRGRLLRVALPLVVLLGAFVAGRSLNTNQVVGTWSGDSVDRINRRTHLTMTFDAAGNESLRVEFSPAGHPDVPPPTVYRGKYFFESGLLVQDLESSHPIPEGTFFDRPLHEAKAPSRELRCLWRVDGDRLYLNARTLSSVVLNRVR